MYSSPRNNFRLKNFRFRENQFINTKSGSSAVLVAAGFFFIYFQKLLAACCQGFELGERLDTVEKAGVVEVGEDVRETGGEKGIFDLGENVRMLNSPKIKPGEVDKFVDEEEEIGVRGKE